MLTPPLRGFYQTLLGKFCFVTLEGATSVPWTHGGEGGGGSIYDTRFTWDLVDDLDSRRSFHDDIWSIKGCLMLLIHWDIFDGFNPLGMLLMLSIH